MNKPVPVEHLKATELRNMDPEGPIPDGAALKALKAQVTEAAIQVQKAMDGTYKRAVDLPLIFGNERVSRWPEPARPEQTSDRQSLAYQLSDAMELLRILEFECLRASLDKRPLVERAIRSEEEHIRKIIAWQDAAVLDRNLTREGS